MSKTTQEKERLLSLESLSFKYCSPASCAEELDSNLVDMLILAQKYAGFQFTITSAFRSQVYERSKGRKGSSSHCKGLAVDISTRDSHTRFKVLVAAVLAGIPRVGVGKTFLHLDIDETKAHPIIFHYYDPQET